MRTALAAAMLASTPLLADMLARKIADETARTFKCGVDKPTISGNRGPGVSGPYGD